MSLILPRPRDEIMSGRLVRPAGRGRYTPKRAEMSRRAAGHGGRKYEHRGGAAIAPAVGGGGGGGGGGSQNPGYIFHSDWGAGGIGNSDTNIQDGTRWGTPIGSAYATYMRSKAAATLSFADCPSTNLMEIDHDGSHAAQVPIANTWPSPGVGEERWLRFYRRNEIANDEGTRGESHHPVDSFPTGGDASWQENYTCNSDGTYAYFVWCDSSHDVSSGKDYAFYPVNGSNVIQNLAKFAFLRFEFYFKKTATNQYSMKIWVYNSSNVLLYGPPGDSPTLGTFRSNNGSSPAELSVTTVHMLDAGITGFKLGTNGGSGLAGMIRTEHTYFAGVAIADSGRCGAYGSYTAGV